jgi:DNA-binding MarR family transcriptional regulator
VIFRALRSLREFEKEHFSVLRTLEDYNLVREIGYYQAEGRPLTLKQLFLLDVGSSATVQRRLRRLREAGVIQQRRAAADRRAIELSLSPKFTKTFEKYGELLYAAARKPRARPQRA